MRWHRLAVVLFGIVLISTFFWAFGRDGRFGRGEYGMMMKMDGKMMKDMDMRGDKNMMKMDMKARMMGGDMKNMMANQSWMSCGMSGCDMMSGGKAWMMDKCSMASKYEMFGCDMMAWKTTSEKAILIAKMILTAIVMTIVQSFILQLLYYKVFLYIVYGNSDNK